jgi:hypothetical protein
VKRSIFAFGCAVVVVGLVYFPVRFALTFELLGTAVRSETGWLGPTPRDAGACVTDVGKVNVWRCSNTEVFSRHKYGCALWLRAFGYTDAYAEWSLREDETHVVPAA